MLGWEVLVFRHGEDVSFESTWARWLTSPWGLKWLDELVAAKKATDLGGNGYPNRYLLTAGEFVRALSAGIPPSDGPAVFGDNYLLPPGWGSGVRVDAQALSACPEDAMLIVEAWDQS